MEFYRLRDVPKREREVVFRESRLRGVLLFSLFVLLSAGALAAGVVGSLRGRPVLISPVMAYVSGAGLLLFAMVWLAGLRASLRPTNWLLRYGNAGLTIKFRSYLNHHFPPEDVVAFFLPNAEIAWARKTREVRRVPRQSEESTENWTYLDLKLRGSEAPDLEAHLRRERTREAPMSGISSTKYHHYPVRLLPEGIVRLEWEGPSTSVVPGIEKALKVLRFSLAIEREASLRPRRGQRAGEEEVEARVLDLAERGDVIAAVNLVRGLYGYDTKTAKEFVEGLLEK